MTLIAKHARAGPADQKRQPARRLDPDVGRRAGRPHHGGHTRPGRIVGGVPYFERTSEQGAASVKLLCEIAAERGKLDDDTRDLTNCAWPSPPGSRTY